MKRTVTAIVALALVFCLVMSLAACGGSSKPSGSYTCTVAGMKFATLEFSGDEVIYASSKSTKHGTFTMDGDTINITYETGGTDTFTYDKDKDVVDYHGALQFEKD